jgi:hypothetical protein
MIAAEKSRTVRLTEDRKAIVIRQTTANGQQVDCYFLKPISGGYELSKHDGLVYRVFLAGKGSCNCPGNRHHKHCKHVESLQALDTAGRLF